jgi:hypothetical protein
LKRILNLILTYLNPLPELKPIPLSYCFVTNCPLNVCDRLWPFLTPKALAPNYSAICSLHLNENLKFKSK